MIIIYCITEAPQQNMWLGPWFPSYFFFSFFFFFFGQILVFLFFFVFIFSIEMTEWMREGERNNIWHSKWILPLYSKFSGSLMLLINGSLEREEKHGTKGTFIQSHISLIKSKSIFPGPKYHSVHIEITKTRFLV